MSQIIKMNNKLVLRRRGFESFQGWQLWFQVSLISIGFIAIGLMYYFGGKNSVITGAYLLSPVLFGLFLWFFSHFMNTTKLEVDEFGLSHHSGLPDFLKFLNPDWRINWGEIQKVSHAKSVISASEVMLPLHLKLLNKTIKIYPIQWVNPEEISPKKSLFVLRNNFISMYEDSPLIKILSKKGLFNVKNSTDVDIESDWADINSSPVALAMTGFLFFALFYFIIEVMVLCQSSILIHHPINTMPWQRWELPF